VQRAARRILVVLIITFAGLAPWLSRRGGLLAKTAAGFSMSTCAARPVEIHRRRRYRESWKFNVYICFVSVS